MNTQDYKGKLTTIYEHPAIQEYLNECTFKPFGYIGHEFRTNETDKIIEDIFSSKDVDKDRVAEWICSRRARDFMNMNGEDIRWFKEGIMKSIGLF